jgi:hypothetical protein
VGGSFLIITYVKLEPIFKFKGSNDSDGVVFFNPQLFSPKAAHLDREFNFALTETFSLMNPIPINGW